jgi:hypothetical protein
MPHQRDNRRIAADRQEGPVKPGTPLHHLLQLIAQEIARSLAKSTSAIAPRRRKR